MTFIFHVPHETQGSPSSTLHGATSAPFFLSRFSFIQIDFFFLYQPSVDRVVLSDGFTIAASVLASLATSLISAMSALDRGSYLKAGLIKKNLPLEKSKSEMFSIT